MDPLTAIAVTISAGSFGVDALMLYRQIYYGPWYLDTTDADLEAFKADPVQSTQTLETRDLDRDSTPNEVSPLSSTTAPSYDSISTEKALEDLPRPTPSTSPEWRPADVPRWFLGLKRSQYFLSPAERPPIFSKWYHYFNLLWPILIVNEFLTRRSNPSQRDLHPQAEISLILCFGLTSLKLVLGIFLELALDPEPPKDISSDTISRLGSRLGMVEAWVGVLHVLCYNGIYWRSRGFGIVPGKLMGRFRVMLFAAMTVGMWVAVWTAREWEWRNFWMMGLPFAMLVGMSYGVAWERWL